jgi:hypothetical protein
MTPADVAWRDAELRKCVKARMTGKQIHEFSQSWPHPFPHVNHLWRRLAKLRLRATEENEQLPHKRAVSEVLVRVAVCCANNGFRITAWRMECSLGEGSGVRSDLWVVIEGHGIRRVRTFEIQRTSQAPWIYARKMNRIKAWRKRKGVEPFRSAWLVEDFNATDRYRYNEVNKAYKIACDVMEDSPQMCLFLVDWLADFRAQYEVLTEDIYMSNQKRREAMI